MRPISVMLSLAAVLAAAAPADAQGRGKGKGEKDIPPGHRPPAGMCRIWIDGVPPGRQPAPTDCDTAVRNQPANSRIIWGENTGRSRSVRDDDRRDRDRRTRRESDGRTYDPNCVDNDRNGWCDYDTSVRSGARAGGYPNPGGTGGTTTPVDRGQYPSQLPAMTGAVLIRVGVRTTDVQNWLGSGTLRSETVDSNGDGVPEQATWYDGNGTILQVWRDDDRDGRADAVEVYRNGQRVQVVR